MCAVMRGYLETTIINVESIIRRLVSLSRLLVVVCVCQGCVFVRKKKKHAVYDGMIAYYDLRSRKRKKVMEEADDDCLTLLFSHSMMWAEDGKRRKVCLSLR